MNLFLTGGAMRDMLAGLRIRDLDFVVGGERALKVAKSICRAHRRPDGLHRRDPQERRTGVSLAA